MQNENHHYNFGKSGENRAHFTLYGHVQEYTEYIERKEWDYYGGDCFADYRAEIG